MMQWTGGWALGNPVSTCVCDGGAQISGCPRVYHGGCQLSQPQIAILARDGASEWFWRAGHRAEAHGDNRFSNQKAVAAHDDRLYTIKSVLDGKWMLAIEVFLCGLTHQSLLPIGPSPKNKFKAHYQATQLKLNVPRYHRSSGRLISARHCARLHCEMHTQSTKVLSTVLHTSHHLWQSKL